MNIHENIEVSYLAETLAENHIRLAIAHIESYLCAQWAQGHFDKQNDKLEKIISQLKEITS